MLCIEVRANLEYHDNAYTPVRALDILFAFEDDIRLKVLLGIGHFNNKKWLFLMCRGGALGAERPVWSKSSLSLVGKCQVDLYPDQL